jgi:hypothetical protein
VDDLLANWYEMSDSPSQEGPAIALSRRAVLRFINSRDLSFPLGFEAPLYSRSNDGAFGIALYLRLGADVGDHGPIPNLCAIDSFGDDVSRDTPLLYVPKLTAILNCLAIHFSPRWAAVLSRQQLPEDFGSPAVGWLTYLEVNPDLLPGLPSGVTFSTIGSGVLINATQTDRLPDNETHGGRLLEVARRLYRAGLLDPVPYWQ